MKNHLVEQAMLAMHGARAMQQHFCAKPFRRSLGLARMLFGSYDEITKLKAEQEELRAQVSVLQREVRSTKLAEFALSAFLLLPLRVLPAGLATGSFLAWPRCSAYHHASLLFHSNSRHKFGGQIRGQV
jgi:small-conductance mechanosensitive channel